MAFKMKGMSFGEGTGYKSPQLMAQEKQAAEQAAMRRAAAKRAREAAMAREVAMEGMAERGSAASEMAGQSPQRWKKKAGDFAVKQLHKVATKVAPKTTKKITTAVARQKDKILGGGKELIGKIKVKGNQRFKAVWDTAKDALKWVGIGYVADKVIDKVSGGDKDKKETKTETTGGDKKTTKKSDQMPDADWQKGKDKAAAEGNDLNALVKKRSTLEKGSDEWKRVQNKINSALGNSKRYEVGDAKPAKTTGDKKEINVRIKEPGGLVGAKKVERETYADGTRKKETKTKGGTAYEGKKVKTREYGEGGELTKKTKEKYGKKVTGEGDTGDWWTGRRKKRKVTEKTDTHVTKTKYKAGKEPKTKTRKRRLVKVGQFLAGKRAG